MSGNLTNLSSDINNSGTAPAATETSSNLVAPSASAGLNDLQNRIDDDSADPASTNSSKKTESKSGSSSLSNIIKIVMGTVGTAYGIIQSTGLIPTPNPPPFPGFPPPPPLSPPPTVPFNVFDLATTVGFQVANVVPNANLTSIFDGVSVDTVSRIDVPYTDETGSTAGYVSLLYAGKNNLTQCHQSSTSNAYIYPPTPACEAQGGFCVDPELYDSTSQHFQDMLTNTVKSFMTLNVPMGPISPRLQLQSPADYQPITTAIQFRYDGVIGFNTFKMSSATATPPPTCSSLTSNCDVFEYAYVSTATKVIYDPQAAKSYTNVLSNITLEPRTQPPACATQMSDGNANFMLYSPTGFRIPTSSCASLKLIECPYYFQYNSFDSQIPCTPTIRSKYVNGWSTDYTCATSALSHPLTQILTTWQTQQSEVHRGYIGQSGCQQAFTNLHSYSVSSGTTTITPNIASSYCGRSFDKTLGRMCMPDIEVENGNQYFTCTTSTVYVWAMMTDSLTQSNDGYTPHTTSTSSTSSVTFCRSSGSSCALNPNTINDCSSDTGQFGLCDDSLPLEFESSTNRYYIDVTLLSTLP